MKLKTQIRHIFRKTIAFALLVYFIFSPLLFAFPIKNCSDLCQMNIEMEKPEHDVIGIEHCMVMRMMQTSAAHDSFNSEFAPFKCSLENTYLSSLNYVQLFKVKINIDLSQISIISPTNDNSEFHYFEKHEINLQIERPPIYIIDSSFLI